MSTFVVILALTGTNVFGLDKQPDAKIAPPQNSTAKIEQGFTITPENTAVLIMDYENDIIGMLPEATREPLVEKAKMILQKALQEKMKVIYVAVRFREGYPEVNPQNKLFSGLKQTGLLLEGKLGAEIDLRLAPQPGDIVVTKRRVGAFSTTDLETIPKSKHINKLVLFGISTSGVVLSTVRWAADMDYSLAVVSDVCADRDSVVNRVLMEKVFPWQTTVVTSAEFMKAVDVKVK